MQISEIFYSIQGEGPHTGLPTIFIRSTFCNLRCTYCDTTDAFYGGEEKSIEQILEKIKQYPCKRICLTGGEPLLQKEQPALITALASEGYEMSIETGGSLSIEHLPPAAQIILDLKTPCSGMQDKNYLPNLALLRETDCLKMVVESVTDLEYAQKILAEHPVACPIIISPVWELKNKTRIANWLLKNPHPNMRIGIQIHKVLCVS